MRAKYMKAASVESKLFTRSRDAPNGCLEWIAGKDVNGYGRLWHNGKNCTAHTEAYKAWINDIPEGLHVLHECDNPSCIRPEHLVLGTHADNMRHKSERKRVHGDRNPMSRSRRDMKKFS